MSLDANLPGLNIRKNILRVPLILTAVYVGHEVYTADFEFMNLFFSYINATAGGGGIADIQIEYSPYSSDTEATGFGVEAWYQDVAFSIGAVASGLETASLVQQEHISYGAEGLTQENFMLQVALNRGMERLRISVLESGLPGTPGTLGIISSVG